MSLSWTYITRRFILQNYRDAIGVGIISSFFVSKFLTYVSHQSDDEWVMTRVYTNDETDVSFRELTNKADGAVKRERMIAFAREVRAARAQREREMQLDAFNFLNGKNHTL